MNYHLEVIDAAVDSSQHLLPLLRGLWTRVQRGTKPGEIQRSSDRANAVMHTCSDALYHIHPSIAAVWGLIC